MPMHGRFLGVGALSLLVGFLIILAAKWFWQFSVPATIATGYAVALRSSTMVVKLSGIL
jgi:hypothetical protein